MAIEPKILVVGDEGDIRQLVRFQLERHGHAVCEAETGEAALTLGGTERPALVILDLMLPDADGYALCRRLRAGESTGTLPIIILSARAGDADRALGLAVGATDLSPSPLA